MAPVLGGFDGPVNQDEMDMNQAKKIQRPASDSSRPRWTRRRALPGVAGDTRLVAIADRSDARSVAVPERDLLWYRDVLRRRWATGLLIFVIVASGISAGVLLRPPVYRATSLLEIRRESTGAVPVDTLFSQERVSNDELETQFGILKSASLAQRVVTQLVADRGARVALPRAQASAYRATPGADVSEEISADSLQERLIVDPLRGSRLVEVSFDSPDPHLAARVVNSVLDNYLQLRMEEAQRSAGWLETQLGNAQRRLEDSERQLQTYVHERGLTVFETGKGEAAELVNDRLRSLHESLAKAESERMDKQSAYELARQQTSSRDTDSPAVQSVSMRLTDLRREHAKLATAFHDDYPAVKAISSQISVLERALNDESERVSRGVGRAYQAAVRREALLRQALHDQDATVQALGLKSAGYESLKREVVTNQQLFATLNQKLKEVSISAALNAANVGIVDRPTPSLEPHTSPLRVSVGLAVMVALLLAMGGIVLQEHFDTSMRTVDDVDGYLGVPTLAAIPAVGPDARLLPSGTSAGAYRSWRRIDQDGRQQSPLAEAFAALRAAVLLRDDAATTRTLLITSAHSAEGKTTVSINLALSLAKLKCRVLLIDANMRYPCVQQALGLKQEPGLVDYLTSEVHWRAFVHADAHANLDVLIGGTPDASPADLLSLARMRQLVAAASRDYDFVILDSPALLAHPADIRSLASLVDDVLLTVRHGATPREAVSFALSQLPNVIGVVMNRSDRRDIPVYYRDVSARAAPV